MKLEKFLQSVFYREGGEKIKCGLLPLDRVYDRSIYTVNMIDPKETPVRRIALVRMPEPIDSSVLQSVMLYSQRSGKYKISIKNTSIKRPY